MFECLIGKDNAPLIASCVETYINQKYITNRIHFIFNIFCISLLWCLFHKFAHCIFRLAEIWLYVCKPYTPVANCEFALDFKCFKITVLYGHIFTSRGFCLHDLEAFFSTHHPKSFKTSDCVITDRSLIVTCILFHYVYCSACPWFH